MALLVLVLVLALGGCAGVPRAVERPVSASLAAPADAPLPQLVASFSLPPGQSAVRPMPLPQDALAARMALFRQARTSIDLQTYHLADDSTGRLVLRALRDAARRGVRVRLLLDDFYTTGMDDLLLGLAAEPNVELRLFNPFHGLRGWPVARFAELLSDFGRLNHRMHNKLLVVDGAFAIAGGRNLADDYFLRSASANFIDFDLLLGGAVVGELAGHFDRYWNSHRVWPLHALADNRLDAEERRTYFEIASAPPEDMTPVPSDALKPTSTSHASLVSPDALRPLKPDLPRGHFDFYFAPAGSQADPPDKQRGQSPLGRPEATDPPRGDRPAGTQGARYLEPVAGSVAAKLIGTLTNASREVTMVSPYFVPGDIGMDRIRALRAKGVQIHVITNATGTSDEPLVAIGYERHRVELLKLGVKLWEVSSGRLKADNLVGVALGSSSGRLHAKMGFVDRRIFLAGSLNLDARSALINTEVGVGVDSPEMVAALMRFYRLESYVGVYELRLKPDGRTIEWVARDATGGESASAEPETSGWLRFKLWLMSLFVSEELL
ncbi:phospholipase D family protein [Aquabacterium humicola]|uniref:phospholipase D family protein n=1 Tax=Aquabacterium humicola TaxID=3237377 RepID=UPI002543C436|nr:phospholipase D family protein [Rubrivivax pictus]